MSIETNADSAKLTEPSPELQKKLLMDRARMMGLNVSPNIGLETLKAKVRAAQEAESTSAADEVRDPDNEVEGDQSADAPNAIRTQVVPMKPAPETENQKRARLVREAMKLVRCRIVCMNPSKKDLKGEFFTIANRYIGTVRKFVPYGEMPDGYHLPQCIYDHLKSRTYLHIQTNEKRGGQILVKTGDMPEFAIELLPQLTPRELNKLAQRQAMAAGTVSSSEE